MLHYLGAEFFQCWQNEQLLVDDVIQRVGDLGSYSDLQVVEDEHGRGRIPTLLRDRTNYQPCGAVRVAGSCSLVPRRVDGLKSEGRGNSLTPCWLPCITRCEDLRLLPVLLPAGSHDGHQVLEHGSAWWFTSTTEMVWAAAAGPTTLGGNSRTASSTVRLSLIFTNSRYIFVKRVAPLGDVRIQWRIYGRICGLDAWSYSLTPFRTALFLLVSLHSGST